MASPGCPRRRAASVRETRGACRACHADSIKTFRACPLPAFVMPPRRCRSPLECYLTREGEQITYVFYKAGIQDVVLRPAFKGKVSEFGMLIPFPTPPAIRKVADDIFPQIGDAVEPPKVVINLYLPPPMALAGITRSPSKRGDANALRYKDAVRHVVDDHEGTFVESEC